LSRDEVNPGWGTGFAIAAAVKELLSVNVTTQKLPVVRESLPTSETRSMVTLENVLILTGAEGGNSVGST